VAGLEFINPEGLCDLSHIYTHVVVGPAGARPVFIAGQWAFDANGELAADDFGGQVDATFRNVAILLDSLGIGREQVAKLTHYVVGLDQTSRAELAKRVAAIWPGNRPASTLLGVAGLAVEGMRYEVDITAVLPD
jgi:enamine deaminase RidA (YjgF/YER057c/UK114 family)